MIMAKTSDFLTRAYDPQARLQFVHVDVTDSARALEQSHLCGPTASLALAEALAGVALLIPELTQPQEAVTLRMRLSGPVQGLLVEATAEGELRGYSNVKVMNDLDVREEMESAEAFGDHANVQIIRSLPGKILAHANLETRPASVRLAVEKYYRHSLQRRAAVQIVAVAYGGALEMAHAVVALGMPDTDSAAFARVEALFNDDTVATALEAHDSMAEWAEEMGFSQMIFEPPKPLKFACRCSRDRVAAMLGALSVSELSAMSHAGKPTTVHCHMCGKGFEIGLEELTKLLVERKKTGGKGTKE